MMAEIRTERAIVDALRSVSSSYYLATHIYYMCPHFGCERRVETGEHCSLGQTNFRRVFWEVTQSSDATASLKVTPEHVHQGHPCQHITHLLIGF